MCLILVFVLTKFFDWQKNDNVKQALVQISAYKEKTFLENGVYNLPSRCQVMIDNNGKVNWRKKKMYFVLFLERTELSGRLIIKSFFGKF